MLILIGAAHRSWQFVREAPYSQHSIDSSQWDLQGDGTDLTSDSDDASTAGKTATFTACC